MDDPTTILRPARPQLDAVLARLAPEVPPAVQRQWLADSGARGWTHLMSFEPYGVTDVRAAWELLQTYGLTPPDDDARAFIGPTRQAVETGDVLHLVGNTTTLPGRVTRVDRARGIVGYRLDQPAEVTDWRGWYARFPRVDFTTRVFTSFGAHLCLERWPQGTERVSSDLPCELADVAAFASDGPGVAAAEALAREVVARLQPWGAPSPPAIQWRFVARGAYRPSCEVPLAWQGARAQVLRSPAYGRFARRNGELARRLHLPESPPLSDAVANDVALADAWNAHDGPNPYAPLVALIGLGYLLDAIAPDAITLVCPEL